MTVDESIRKLLGKRIRGVVLKQRGTTPKGQLFLLLDDCSYFEFYSTEGVISGTKQGVCGGDIESVREYMADSASITREYLEEPS
jgi:hypothetical protein